MQDFYRHQHCKAQEKEAWRLLKQKEAEAQRPQSTQAIPVEDDDGRQHLLIWMPKAFEEIVAFNSFAKANL